MLCKSISGDMVNSDKKDTSIALIIVNWNSGNWLCRCVKGISKQILQPSQIIVVDNGSTDNSLDGIEEILPDIEIIRGAENLGFAKANNLALKSITKTRWTVLLNPDAVPEPDWLNNLIHAAQAYPNYSFFACKMLNAEDPSKFDGIGDIYHTSGHAWRQGFGKNASCGGEEAKECFSPCAAAAMYRTDIIQEAGGFDERFFCYMEDVDLGFRLHLMGHRCLYVPEAIVAHAGSATSGKRSDFSVYYGHRNMIWTYFKNMPWILFWVYLPQHIVMNVFGVFALFARGQGAIGLQAKYDAIKRLPSVLSDRQKIQDRKQISSKTLWRMMSKGFFSLLKRD